jgi:predicted metal-dependent hydrolase
LNPLHHPLFVKFIVYFNRNQDYFECHEVLEEYWKSLPDGNKEHPLTAYILLATGMYHWRRGNLVGAYRTLKKANEKMNTATEVQTLFTDGIDFNLLRNDVHSAINQVDERLPFTFFHIAVTSPALLQLTSEMEQKIDLLPFGSDAIIHKHMLRNRGDILQERNKNKSDSLKTDE